MKTIPATEISIDSNDVSDSRTVAFEQMHRHSTQSGASTFTELSVSSGERMQEPVDIVITLNRASRELTGHMVLTHDQTKRLIEGLEKAINDTKEREARYAEYEASTKKTST